MKIKRRVLRELMKALSGEEDEELEYFKGKLLEHLEKLEKQERTALKKALLQAESMAKGGCGLPLGSVGVWKGKKYIKVGDKRWARKYEEGGNRTKSILGSLRTKVDDALTCEELARIVVLNKEKFSGKEGKLISIGQVLLKKGAPYGNQNARKNKKGQPARQFCTNKEHNLRDEKGNIIGKLPKGTEVTKIEVIAHGEDIQGGKRGIDDVVRLVDKYRLQNGELTSKKDWYKMKGKATFSVNGIFYESQEIHWYQCKNVGKFEFKTKDKKRLT